MWWMSWEKEAFTAEILMGASSRVALLAQGLEAGGATAQQTGETERTSTAGLRESNKVFN